MIHPTAEKIRALSDRWVGQEARLQRVAASILSGEDWTQHLRGLPFLDEVPPKDGEAYGRDLRGADLRRFLYPKVDVTRATERDAALVAGLERAVPKAHALNAGRQPAMADSGTEPEVPPTQASKLKTSHPQPRR